MATAIELEWKLIETIRLKAGSFSRQVDMVRISSGKKSRPELQWVWVTGPWRNRQTR